jgi:drug/metabolite transporter (DMT)-like permease
MAATPTLAKLAFEAGSNTLTVVTLRTLIGAALMAGALLLLARAVLPPRAAWPAVAAGSACYAVMSVSFIGAAAYIPAGLTLLIFFIHPIMLAALAHFRGQDRLTPRRAGLAALALAGLGLVVGDVAGEISAFGVGLALLSAVAVCGTILCSVRVRAHTGSVQTSLAFALGAAPGFVLATTLGSAWALPSGAVGWAALLGSGLCIAVGLAAFFAAYRHIGMLRAAMVSYVEPLIGVLFAMALLGERLDALQWAGALVTIGALVLMEVRE